VQQSGQKKHAGSSKTLPDLVGLEEFHREADSHRNRRTSRKTTIAS
jgi:hypothetical protein